MGSRRRHLARHGDDQVNKLRVRRNRRHWVVEQNGVMVDYSLSFRIACKVAAIWLREGWVVAQGWYAR